jgi:hypothetical protein
MTAVAAEYCAATQTFKITSGELREFDTGRRGRAGGQLSIQSCHSRRRSVPGQSEPYTRDSALAYFRGRFFLFSLFWFIVFTATRNVLKQHITEPYITESTRGVNDTRLLW